ncbi:hypothetical protein SLS60_004436 [Paraconiothyrium brasiliense]|uniref:Heterokaryon incompatibility domain-containing protein n=1 Tax=Paraconiothyrium brasiliense TaxID=300254 RepID=A0ABR3RKD0_9PLEO
MIAPLYRYTSGFQTQALILKIFQNTSGIKNKKTSQIVKESVPIPKYAAISHTWGRWAKKEREAERIKFSGVPWKIYDNDKFDYRRLPDLLRALDIPVRYIWIDLLTIPQLDPNENDGNIESKEQREFEEERRNEIARQTTIFQNASYVIAWLKDDIDWKDFPKAIKCMTSEFLDKAFLDNPTRELLVTTSTRDYVKELLDLMKNTGLINLPTLSQLSILAMATHRECSNDQREGINDQRRAQAIMSALGVTDWYQTMENWAKGMVLKQYPLPFVNEAKLKIGSSAFFASEPRGVSFRKILADYVGEVEKVRNIDEYESMKSLGMDQEWLKVEKQRWRDKEIESRQKQVRSGVVGEPDKMKKIQTKKKGCGTKRDLDEREEKLKKRKMKIMKKATRSIEEVFQKIREDIGKNKVGVGSMLPFGPGAQDMIANVEPNEHIVEHESPKSWQIDAEGRVHIQEAGIVIKTQ